MARTVNEREFTKKRNEILDAAMQLVFAKGYERMTIQDILAELKISSGAFYHYFGSKPALLEAFIERMREVSAASLHPVIADTQLTAIEKLRGFFDTFDRLRLSRREDVLQLGRVWYTDENAIVRSKVDEAIIKHRAPLLNLIVRQGIEEGVFTVPHPDQAGEVILSLLWGMGNSHAKLLFAQIEESDQAGWVERVVAVYGAYMGAIERVLGAPPGSLCQLDGEKLQVWVDAIKEGK